MKKYIAILNGGSLAGLVSFLLFLTLYYLFSINPFGPWKFVGLAVPAFFMYKALITFRETEGEGFLTYGRGFVLGVMFSFFYSSLSAMLIYLYGLILDAGFLELFVTENLQALGEAKSEIIGFLGKDTYEEMLNEFKDFTLEQLAMNDFQSKSFGSIAIALIASAIVKQKPPTFEAVDE